MRCCNQPYYLVCAYFLLSLTSDFKYGTGSQVFPRTAGLWPGLPVLLPGTQIECFAWPDCLGTSGSGFIESGKIRIHVRIRIQYWWPKIEEKKYSCNFFYIFLWSNTAIYLAFKLQEKPFSPQKRTNNPSKVKIYQLFSIFLGHFCPPGSGSTTLVPVQEKGGICVTVLAVLKKYGSLDVVFTLPYRSYRYKISVTSPFYRPGAILNCDSSLLHAIIGIVKNKNLRKMLVISIVTNTFQEASRAYHYF